MLLARCLLEPGKPAGQPAEGQAAQQLLVCACATTLCNRDLMLPGTADAALLAAAAVGIEQVAAPEG